MNTYQHFELPRFLQKTQQDMCVHVHAGEEIDQLTGIKGLANAVTGTGKYGICRTGWQAVNLGRNWSWSSESKGTLGVEFLL